MIRFGAWSTLLAALSVQLAVLACLLLNSPSNRLANRYLSMVLVCIVGMLTPFILGYAGFYDAYPWLTSAPFSIPLAVGPLLFAYVRALSRDRALRAGHFVLPALQFLYQALLFPFPTATKYWWDGAVYEPYLGPAFALAVLASLTFYSAACARELKEYEAWLERRRRDRRPARRIRLAALALALLLASRAGYDLFSLLVRPVDYFDLFGFYVLLAMVGLLLGADGWRNARESAPPIADPPDRDWSAQGAEWLRQLRESEWWRDPDLDLAGLARRLGTNSGHLSRALNQGNGGFAAALGAIRAEAVADAISAGSVEDLLALALESGFGSKASFNRAFSTRFGVSPSEYRAALRLTA